MKLNRKGYMLVEIIVSFSVAMGIAFYLINLTYKFVDNNDIIYQDSLYMKDKILITKNIMNDLDNGVVTTIDENNSCEFELKSLNSTDDVVPDDGHIADGENINEKSINRKLEIDKGILKYGMIENGNFITDDVSYYEKQIESSLQFGTAVCKIENGIFSIIIPLRSIYSDEVYDIKLMAKVDG